ncbi:MAG: Ldh family oxidoreductase [Dehalococcoidia bacterium]|nr:Ldh family oxidoreductase [Dehalococcoidia bacterium]
MSDPRERFDAAALRAHTAATLEYFGMPAADAAIAAEVLVDADLKGIESHGIAHLTWHGGYVPGLRDGRVNPTPTVSVLRETPATLALDGDGGMGVVVAVDAMDRCIARAEANGIGMVTIRNGRHFGAAGYYAERAAARGLIGMASCNTPVLAVPAGGAERAFGTNPIAFAAPIAGREPFSLDMATTAVAGGKLEIAGRQGKRLPSGWAVDADGNESDDPAALGKGGALLPLGSSLETSSYKGYGLGLVSDILSGVLSGAGFGMIMPRPHMGQWFAAWRIDAFRDPDEFQAEMADLADRIHAIPPAPGVDRVRIPGDKEAEARADRDANGIPLDSAVVDQLRELAAETGVFFPDPVGSPA